MSDSRRALAALALAMATTVFAGDVRAVPHQQPIVRYAEPIPGQYIVTLKETDRGHAAAATEAIAARYGGEVRSFWLGSHGAFLISTTDAAAKAMARDRRVVRVEENAVVHESGERTVGGSGVADPFWHLDRIDQRLLPLDGNYQYCTTGTGVVIYIVDVGVLGSHPDLGGRVASAGINAGHEPFGPNSGREAPPPYSDANDLGVFTHLSPCGQHNWKTGGHGTAVATVAAGSTLGVASGATIVSIRTRPCSDGTSTSTALSNLAEGLAWIESSNNSLYWDAAQHRSKVPAVLNISSYIPTSVSDLTTPSAAEQTLRELIQGGITVVVSANNQDRADAAIGTPNILPAQIPTRMSYSAAGGDGIRSWSEHVISVGGTMLSSGADRRWHCSSSDPNRLCGRDVGSNYGIGVDIWAPADDVQTGHHVASLPDEGDRWTGSLYRRPFLSTQAEDGPNSTTRQFVRSGTSFAAPAVTGAIARLLTEDPTLFDASQPGLTPGKVWQRLRDSATPLDRAAANLGSTSANGLLYIGAVSFSQQPQATALADGGTRIDATAVGGSSVTYQLYLAAQAGDTSHPVGSPQSSGTFIVYPAQPTTYWIRATRTCPVDGSSVTGDSRTVSAAACTPPSISAQPQNVTITSGSPTTLSVTAGGPGPFTYQWYRLTSSGGSEAIGTNSSTLTVAPSVDTGYFVWVYNACNAVVSNLATVSMCVAPSITAHPQDVTIISGSPTTLSVTAAGTGPFLYKWYRLTSSGGSEEIVNNSPTLTVAPQTTTGYFVWVYGTCGTVESNLATVSMCVAPSITSQPQNVTITPGSSTTLSVTAGGSGPFTYRWYRLTSSGGSEEIVNNSPTLTVAPQATTGYFVWVYGMCGAVESDLATVTVCTPVTITSHPQNVTIASGSPTTLSVTASGTGPFAYFWYQATPSGSVSVGTNSNTLTVAPTATSDYFVWIYNACSAVISNQARVTVQ